MKAQEWLAQNYPNQKESSIYLNQQLAGVLDCGEYKNLEYIFISSSVDSSKLEIKKGSYKDWDWQKEIKETNVIPCLLAQTYLDQNYPSNGTCQIKEKESWKTDNFGKTREEIKNLDISRIGLEGNLDLSDFPNLEELNCWGNFLTNLKANNCGKLWKIKCSNNELTTLNLSNLAELKELYCSDNYLTQIPYFPQPEKISSLDIRNNNLNHSNLTIFSQFRNLEELWIGNWDKIKINQNIYNRFAGSCEPCQDLTKLKRLVISNTDLNSGWEYLPDSLGHFVYDTELRPNCKLSKVKEHWDQELWKDIHQDFAPLYKKDWLEAGFNKEQTKKFLEEWSRFKIKPEEGAFINWFLNFKKLDLNWTCENEEEFKYLRDKYKNFGTCKECEQPNTSYEWCHSCNAQHFQQKFNTWTSGNLEIDKFIQQCQLEATSTWNLLEWIPYEKFDKKIELNTINSELQSLNLEYENLKSKSNIKQLVSQSKKEEIEKKIFEYSFQVARITYEIKEGKGKVEPIAQGGFGKVEKAWWEGSSIWGWDGENNEWKRGGYEEVALKTLFNSQNLSQDFLQELTLYKMFRSEVSNMVPCYGISKDKEGNYIMVMEYMAEGNLREYLRKNYRELDFKKGDGYQWDDEYPKLHFLQQITQGLKDIHRKKLVHRDFHSGNIVVDKNIFDKYSCHITDLGLSQPVSEEQTEHTIYGLMPYMAPEVLKGEKYTQKSDIYSLGMIMYEILTCLPPYAEYAHDTNLALRIIRGEKPQFPNQIKYPQLLVDLIKQCWDSEPNNRPSAREISGIVGEWFDEYDYLKIDIEFYRQCQLAEEFNKTLPEEIKYPTYHSQEVWYSKPINTQKITELLTSQGVTLDLGSLSIQEESSTQTQIQVSPKQ